MGLALFIDGPVLVCGWFEVEVEVTPLPELKPVYRIRCLAPITILVKDQHFYWLKQYQKNNLIQIMNPMNLS